MDKTINFNHMTVSSLDVKIKSPSARPRDTAPSSIYVKEGMNNPHTRKTTTESNMHTYIPQKRKRKKEWYRR